MLLSKRSGWDNDPQTHAELARARCLQFNNDFPESVRPWPCDRHQRTVILPQENSSWR
jgi:hypothetical protein